MPPRQFCDACGHMTYSMFELRNSRDALAEHLIFKQTLLSSYPHGGDSRTIPFKPRVRGPPKEGSEKGGSIYDIRRKSRSNRLEQLVVQIPLLRTKACKLSCCLVPHVGIKYSTMIFGRTESMLADSMLADLHTRAARVCWCKCTGCIYNSWPKAVWGAAAPPKGEAAAPPTYIYIYI